MLLTLILLAYSKLCFMICILMFISLIIVLLIDLFTSIDIAILGISNIGSLLFLIISASCLVNLALISEKYGKYIQETYISVSNEIISKDYLECDTDGYKYKISISDSDRKDLSEFLSKKTNRVHIVSTIHYDVYEKDAYKYLLTFGLTIPKEDTYEIVDIEGVIENENIN